MAMLSAAYRTPFFSDMRTMVWRGAITVEKMAEALRFQMTREDFIAGYASLVENIPGPQDLIRFVIREVLTVEAFNAAMARQGYPQAWSSAFWEAHWRDMDETRIHEAYHRGILTLEERDKFLVLIDYRPTARPGISKSDLAVVTGLAKTLVPRVDLRYGWEMGSLTDEQLVGRYRQLGYEDDAELMAEIQKARAMEAEIGKVRDEWVAEYISGYITEDILRSNLEALGMGPDRIDYYVAYAKKRRDRDHKKALLAIYVDGYAKDLLKDAELEARAGEILRDPEAIKLLLDQAYVNKYKKSKAS